jgi:SAM-dependent methyltransferase
MASIRWPEPLASISLSEKYFDVIWTPDMNKVRWAPGRKSFDGLHKDGGVAAAVITVAAVDSRDGVGTECESWRGERRHCLDRLTCVEVNRALADALRHRQMDRNVHVVCEDATAMSFPDQTFDGALCFTMLHHVPSAAMQDRLLSEVARVLRSGGVFAGTDGLYSRSFRLLHLFDAMVVVDPPTFAARLRIAGFDDINVDVMKPYAFRFRARKPNPVAV